MLWTVSLILLNNLSNFDAKVSCNNDFLFKLDNHVGLTFCLEPKHLMALRYFIYTLIGFGTGLTTALLTFAED